MWVCLGIDSQVGKSLDHGVGRFFCPLFDSKSEKMYNRIIKTPSEASRIGLHRQLTKSVPGQNIKGKLMKYQVHRLEVSEANIEEKLERFLNRLEGEVLSVFPYTTPKFQGMGATSKVKFLLIVEKTK